jgi:hypothetical protein
MQTISQRSCPCSRRFLPRPLGHPSRLPAAFARCGSGDGAQRGPPSVRVVFNFIAKSWFAFLKNHKTLRRPIGFLLRELRGTLQPFLFSMGGGGGWAGCQEGGGGGRAAHAQGRRNRHAAAAEKKHPSPCTIVLRQGDFVVTLRLRFGSCSRGSSPLKCPERMP